MRYENGKPVGRHPDRGLDPASRRDADLGRRAQDHRALYPRGLARRLDRQGHASGTSTRPASSSSAAPTAMPASPAARSSSTPMVARPRMAAAPSRARTRPRSTARRPMRRATSPRTSSPPVSPTAPPSSSATPSASPSRCRSMSTCTAPARSTRPSSRTALGEVFDLIAARHPHPPRAQQADLRQDLGLRPFRPQARPRRLASAGKRPTWSRR